MKKTSKEEPTARAKATMKWMKEHKESINMSFDKGTKDLWKGYASKAGLSMVEFVRRSVEEKAERDGLATKNEAE